MLEHQISHAYELGHGLQVIDDLVSSSSIASLYAFLEQLPYLLNDLDTDETAHARHWRAVLPLPLALATPVLERCIGLTEQLMGMERDRLRCVQSNLHLYGDMQFPHVDFPSGVTAVYYANPDWSETHLGETVFYDENREPVYMVAPRPGRLAVFHADILHRAGVPSRECYQPRISVAFKFAGPGR